MKDRTSRAIDHSARRRPGGFTLAELLLVLVILAVLAAVVVPKFSGRSEQAKVTAAKADISNLGGAISFFEIDCTRYPTTEEGLRALFQQPPELEDWKGPYLEREVLNDAWGNPYVYQCPGQHKPKGYDLYSFGPDGQEGGGDDIDNWSGR